MVPCKPWRIESDRRGLQLLLVVEPARPRLAKTEAAPWDRALRDLDEGRVRVGIDNRRDTARIPQDIVEHIGAEPRVERNRYDARPHRAVHDLDELVAVADRHGQAIAWLEAKPRRQAGEAIQSLFHLAIGDLDRLGARQVDERRRLRPALRCSPGKVAEIVVADMAGRKFVHDLTLSFARGAVTCGCLAVVVFCLPRTEG